MDLGLRGPALGREDLFFFFWRTRPIFSSFFELIGAENAGAGRG